MLGDLRVVDLSDHNGLLAGQILADLGAEVVQVEGPEGNPARRVGPYASDGSSLLWLAYTRNKRPCTVDLETAAGVARLLELVNGADVLIESARPGVLAGLGLGYADLAVLNPQLVYCSIAPFGQTGPKAHYHMTDLTLMAAAGQVYLTGEAGRQPLRISVPQAHCHAGSDAALAILIALAERDHSGAGQHIDISAQQSTVFTLLCRSLDVALGQEPATRAAGGVRVGELHIRTQFQARDGWLLCLPSMAPTMVGFFTRLMQWPAEQGLLDADLAAEDWSTFGLRLLSGQLPPSAWERCQAALGQLFARHTVVELMNQSVARKLLLAPAFSVGQVFDSPHMYAREFAWQVDCGAPGTARVPGPFSRFSAAPLTNRHGPIAGPVQVGAGHDIAWPDKPAGTTPAHATSAAPLAGVKILDLFWVVAGPAATRVLADYGATVVRIESSERLDTFRIVPPFKDGIAEPLRAAGYQSSNANKLNLALDLSSSQGQALLQELVMWADVVTESFAPGVAARFGVSWQHLAALRPDLIMISSCLLGQSGPWSSFAGFGNMGGAISGFSPLAAEPGRPPVGPYGPYTDFVGARYNAISILAALRHRARTGQGQYIDNAQAEGALHFAAPALLEHALNGHITQAVGNADHDLFPHAVYACAGADRWLALALQDDDLWPALCTLIGAPGLTADGTLARAAGRRNAAAAIDQAVGAWCATRDPAECEQRLQACGIAAHVVANMYDLHADEQLRQRGHFVDISDPHCGSVTVEGSRWRLSRSAARVPTAAVTWQGHRQQILGDILGYDAARISALADGGILK